jgi:hypothetical protein
MTTINRGIKKVLAATLIFFSIQCHAQRSYLIKADTLITSDSIKIAKGSSIKIGYGSRPDGGYSFIFIAPKNYQQAKAFVNATNSPVIYLTSGWADYKMSIEDFKVNGPKAYLILRSENSKKNAIPYMCDLSAALAKREIIIQ